MSESFISEQDDFIIAINKEMGDEVYDTVVLALTELNDYNPRGRYPVSELWDFEEGRRATLGGSVEFIVRLRKTNKSKKTEVLVFR